MVVSTICIRGKNTEFTTVKPWRPNTEAGRDTMKLAAAPTATPIMATETYTPITVSVQFTARATQYQARNSRMAFFTPSFWSMAPKA